MKTTHYLHIAGAVMLLVAGAALAAQPAAETQLSLQDCLNLALKQNPAVLKAQQEIRRAHGVIAEARAEALPRVTATGQYKRIDENFIESFPGNPAWPNQKQPWAAQVEVSQVVYAGGKVTAALRAARLTDQIAALDFQRVVADTVLQVRRTFYEILLGKAQVTVREQSLRLLEQQLEDTRHRFDVGAVPRFNVLRAEVELANAKPPLIRAQNNLRLAKESLVKLLALDTPGKGADFTTINFAGELLYQHRPWTLPEALTQALQKRPELQQAEKQVGLARENVRAAKAGYKPQIDIFGDYGIRNTTFGSEVDETLHGWTVGARATWPVFDGLLTFGRVQQARAQQAKAELDAADARRAVELEVRQAYSDYVQALELIEAQKKTVESAEESLRLAEARFRAGTGTQLDVLSAQTALTEARSNAIQALYDYNVAIATLDRVTGVSVKAE
jgi:TolC family type I secretion outer membrane protein